MSKFKIIFSLFFCIIVSVSAVALLSFKSDNLVPQAIAQDSSAGVSYSSDNTNGYRHPHHHHHHHESNDGFLEMLLQLLILLIQLLGGDSSSLQELTGSGVLSPAASQSAVTSTSLILPTVGQAATATPIPCISNGVVPSPATLGGINCAPVATIAVSSSTATIIPTLPSSSISAQPSNIIVSAQPSIASVSAQPPSVNGNIWAGYAFQTPNLTSGSITSTWTVSSVTCSSVDEKISPWIGFGGSASTDKNIAQLGTDIGCIGGAVTNEVWTEAYPAAMVFYPNNKVNTGDTITTTVNFTGGGNFTTNIKDTTAGWSLDTPMSFSGYTPQSAEVIAEGPVDGYTTIPKFTPITFNNSTYSLNGGAQQQLATGTGLERLEIYINNTPATQTSAVNSGSFTVTKL